MDSYTTSLVEVLKIVTYVQRKLAGKLSNKTLSPNVPKGIKNCSCRQQELDRTGSSFGLFLKVRRDRVEVACSGRQFQTRAVATGNVLLPTVDSRVDGTMSEGVDDDLGHHTELMSATCRSSSARYSGKNGEKNKKQNASRTRKNHNE